MSMLEPNRSSMLLVGEYRQRVRLCWNPFAGSAMNSEETSTIATRYVMVMGSHRLAPA